MDWGKKPRRRRLVALLPALAATLLAGCSTESLPSNALPETHEEAETPAAFLDFCVRFPDQCAKQQGTRTRLTLDDRTMQQLITVNHAVNTAITPEDDKTHYGVDDYWTIPSDGRGDCEDYALTKRRDLLAAGLPASVLRMAVVYSIKTALHAVLTVATDKGDLVLDNANNEIVLWNATDYTWIMVQNKANPMVWDSLRPASAHRGSTGGRSRVSLTNLLTDPDGK
ncbi:MAG: transglutaminase-like cysteine peptidase [Rhizomicrobium sp.]